MPGTPRGGTREDADGSGVGRVTVRVRYAETDQMGRAYHTHFLVWCEVGRTALLRQLGSSYSELESRGVFLPVSRLEIEYRGSAGYEDLVEVRTFVESVRSRSVTFGYRLRRLPGGELLARARTELVCTGANGRMRRLPEAVQEELSRRAGAAVEDGAAHGATEG